MTNDGVLIEQQTSLPSWPGGECAYGRDPGGDWYSFKGILAAKLGTFVQLTHDVLSNDTLSTISTIIRASSDSLWVNASAHPPFSERDLCNTNFDTQAAWPKFNWLWHLTSPSPSPSPMSPDTHAFFRKPNLRCESSNNTELWKGIASDENACQSMCAGNATCQKYSYCADCKAYEGVSCWLWPYSRTAATCSVIDKSYVLGIKRTDNVCRGQCGVSHALPLSDGGECWCDAECAANFDCCLDYADECYSADASHDASHDTEVDSLQPDLMPPFASTPPWSCWMRCDSLTPGVLPGGGYCWCDLGCQSSTSADEKCCADFADTCAPDALQCMDPRTQGSALSLFVTDFMLQNLNFQTQSPE